MSPELHAGSFKGHIESMAECNAESSVDDVQGAKQRAKEDGAVTMEEGRCKPCTCREGSRAASATVAPTGTHDANPMLSTALCSFRLFCTLRQASA